MITVDVRRQGGAAIMTIPADLLKMLDIGIGSRLDLDIDEHALIARPHSRKTPYQRFTLAQLLKGATHSATKALNKKTTWAREGAAVGQEVI